MTPGLDAMKPRPWLVAVALVGLIGVAAGQTKSATIRAFTYTAADRVDNDYSQTGAVILTSSTNISVRPYLYVTGSLSANWVVEGWGSGNDTQTNTIHFYHNETLTVMLCGFDNPTKVSGTPSGAQAVDQQGQLRFSNGQNSLPLFDTGLVGMNSLNGAVEIGAQQFNAGATDGILCLDFTRKIQLTPAIGPGTYQNAGTITVIRN